MAKTSTWQPGDPIAPLRAVLDRGGVLAIPTESSYGLAVDPRNAAGVEAVYRIKARERGKPLPVVVATVGQLRLLGVDPESPEVELAARYWPAPLTMVLPLLLTSAPLPAAARGGSVAVRIPAHDGLRRLLAELGPLTATSANPAGEAPALDPAELVALLAGHDAVIVDGGRLPGGPPSTLVALDADGTPRILRAGAFPPERLRLATPAEGVVPARSSLGR